MNTFAYRVITPQGESWNAINLDHVINASIVSEEGYTIGIRLITTAATTKDYESYPENVEIDSNGLIRLHKNGAQKVKYTVKEVQKHFMPLINHPQDAVSFAMMWGIPVEALNFKPEELKESEDDNNPVSEVSESE